MRALFSIINNLSEIFIFLFCDGGGFIVVLEGAFSSLGICVCHIFNDFQGVILIFNLALKFFVGRQFMAVVSADAFCTDCF